MNKKYLKENNLYEAHKQFMRLCEWSYVPSSLEEDDNEDPNGMPPANGGEDPNGMPPAGDDMPPMDDPNGAPPPPGGGEDPNGMPPADDGMPPMDDPNGAPPPPPSNEPPMGNDMPPMGEEGSDDEVIDVDDITNAQEKVNDKVNTVGKNLGKVDDKIEDLMHSIDSMLKRIEQQNQEISTLKQEFNKRNPTSVEKLNMRSLDSYPFNVKPDEYWRDKSATSNYQGYADNDEPTTDEYTITNNDVDDFDERTMADSFAIDPDWEQDIKKIFEL